MHIILCALSAMPYDHGLNLMRCSVSNIPTSGCRCLLNTCAVTSPSRYVSLT